MTALPEQASAKRLGLVIDLDICVGCHACAVNCKEWNTGGIAAPLTDMNPYGAFALYIVAILGFVAVTLLMNRVLGPKPKPTALKMEPFECGATALDTRNVKAVPIKYYAVAIAFLLFDLETVFLYIWAMGAQPLTGFMLFTFFIFAFLLVAILLYVYRARLLEAVTE